MDVVIKPVSEELMADFLHFFDDIAFTDNKDWSGCYCYFYHFSGSDDEFNLRSAEDNRLSAVSLLQEDKMRGYLAYVDGEPIGWCNVNDRGNYARIAQNKDIRNEKEELIASIVCFIIAPSYRRKGVATRILDVICEDYSGKGYGYIEAYPRKGQLTNAQQYHGPLSMYTKKGFFLHETLEGYDIIRKKLS